MTSEIRGCGTSLVTPFRRDGSVDESALRQLVQFQLRAGIDFLVPCGTTGEAPTLEYTEYEAIIRTVVEEVGEAIPVIAGLGGNNTKEIIELLHKVPRLGIQGILSVAPYYNKPTQEGIYQHFKAIAESTPLPIILYNVPGRTSSNIDPATVVRLSKIPNVIGIKETSGSILQQLEVLNAVEPGFRVFSGDDALTLPLIAAGAVGVIAAVSNEIPGPMRRLTHLCLCGNYEEARKLNAQIFPLIQANFIETNPIPVKAALAMMGMIEEVYRQPLGPMHPENRAKLERALAAQGLLQLEKA